MKAAQTGAVILTAFAWLQFVAFATDSQNEGLWDYFETEWTAVFEKETVNLYPFFNGFDYDYNAVTSELSLNELMKLLANYIKQFKSNTDYHKLRKHILDVEALWRFGSTQDLTYNDKLLNYIYTHRKLALFNASYSDETRYRPSVYFLTHQLFMNPPENDVYKILRRLPKGALLHSHFSATQDIATYPQLLLSLENCQICENENKYKLRYFDDGVQDMSSDYTCRKCPSPGDSNYTAEVDNLRGQVSMYDGVDYSGQNIQMIWDNFQNKFGPTSDAKRAWHVWKIMLNSSLSLLVEDNVQYIEFRTGFGDLIDKNGTVIPYEQVLEYLQEQIELFRNLYPNFYGANLVLTKSRVGLSEAKLKSTILSAQKYYDMSDLIRGFDLVGCEETGRTLKSLLPVFFEFKNETKSDMPFVFHAGETLWTGFDVDQNVVDAILLGSKRIGHGYALDAHPYVLELLRELEIGIELNPISNQVLALVDDIRNHRNKRVMDITNRKGLVSDKPLKFSVNSDDCLIFGTKPMTDDMYMMVMAMTSKESDLRVVKRMAYDSIHTSLLTPNEKKEAIEIFEKEWNRVVQELLKELLA